MTGFDGAVVGFCLFVALLALFIGWFISWGQSVVDRRWADNPDPDDMAQAMRRWPP